MGLIIQFVMQWYGSKGNGNIKSFSNFEALNLHN